MFTSCTSSGRWSSRGAIVSHWVTCVLVAESSSPTQSTYAYPGRSALDAICFTWLGTVAEKSSVWRWRGMNPRILSMLGLNPISSSWSASSSTSTLRFWHLGWSPDVSKWSMRRPGVATRKSHRCEFILPRSDLMFVPPNTTCDLSAWNLSSLSDSSWICDASSRVGESTSTETSPARIVGDRSSVSMDGTRNAIVLPDPVLALARTSRPLRMGGKV
mmetsp:Transcript_12513/g.50268  ORF Transcript_12513/g.50268 Transcript_12513/m.50268 type:complete len:217 (+) Transcript_12513:579-1229(+)